MIDIKALKQHIWKYRNTVKLEEFVNLTKIMFKVPEWLVPLDRKEEFILDSKLGKYRDKWKDCYLILGVFHAFEDDGKWYFSVNIDGKNMGMPAYKKLEK